MRKTLTCPKCDSREIWVINEMKDRARRRQDIAPLAVVAAYLPGMMGAQFVEGGTFETWICVHCGFTEWYAKNVNETLARLVSVPQAGVRYIDGRSGGSPFR